jgi:hypothetical protein
MSNSSGCGSPTKAYINLPATAEDRDLICSRQVARELMGRLASAVGPLNDDGRAFYVFAAEKQRVRIRLIRS